MKILDCTLRDGANVVGNGFSKELTVSMLENLVKHKISFIEYGNAYGIGAYEEAGSIAPLTDQEYLDLAKPYLDKAEIGMFMGAKNAAEKHISLAAGNGMHFLRIGENAGDGIGTYEAVKLVKKHGMKAYYSAMKAYVVSPEELLEEAKGLEACGLDGFTIMDSAGTMYPEQVAAYVQILKQHLSMKIGFHGHNNCGLSMANAMSAIKSGADWIDAGLMGMARSAGNLPTELGIVALEQKGLSGDMDLLGLLHYIEEDLIPKMEKHQYHCPISPLDLILGYAGCHSNFLPLFKRIAKEHGVDLFRLIIETSKQNQKNPTESLIGEMAVMISK